eukprot:3201219-Rhodomonas_salina.2
MLGQYNTPRSAIRSLSTMHCIAPCASSVPRVTQYRARPASTLIAFGLQVPTKYSRAGPLYV